MKALKAGNVLVAGILLATLFLAGCLRTESGPKACALDAKICPDGTAVGRMGPDCEFAPCPNASVAQPNVPNASQANQSVACGYCQYPENGSCVSYQCCADADCGANSSCSGHRCTLRQGCRYGNPPCGENEECANNACALRKGCAYGNPPCPANASCSNNACVLKSGCQYGNPSCGANYDCIGNGCVLKPGCAYGNPGCDADHDCIANQCVLKAGCQYGNPKCDTNLYCVNNQCVNKQCVVPSGLADYSVNISGEGNSSAIYDARTVPGSPIRVVCQDPCPVSDLLLNRKYAALEKSVGDLTSITGTAFVGKYTPIDFHYTSDNVCGDYKPGDTGYYAHGADGRGYACLFFHEKSSLVAPFDENNACRQAGTLLEVHEATHALFDDTDVSYWIQENFAKTLSFYIGGYYKGGDADSDSSFVFGMSACDQRMKPYAPLSYELCRLYGIDVSSYRKAFTRMDSMRSSGQVVNDHDFKSILDGIAGQDTSQAFINANVTLVT